MKIDPKSLTRKDIENIALFLHSCGFFYCEAYPDRMWKQNLFEFEYECEEIYRLIDAHMKLYRELEKFGIKIKRKKIFSINKKN